MTTSNGTWNSPPNATTPYAFLPPDLAFQLAVGTCLVAAVMGAWLWDMLMSMIDEIHMLKKGRLALPDVVYVVSRISSGVFVTTSFFFVASPISDCQTMLTVNGWFGAFATPSNSLLFFLRARGIFYHSRVFIVILFVLWMSTLTSFASPFSSTAMHIGPTLYCTVDGFDKKIAIGFLTVGVFDTIVFISISIHLSSYGSADTWKGRMSTLFSGKNMGYLTRGLLKTGQVYYLATVGLNILVIILLSTPAIPPAYRAMATVPNLALQNAMACRVFRLLKLGVIPDPSSFPEVISQSVRFAPPPGTSGSVSTEQQSTERGADALNICMSSTSSEATLQSVSRCVPDNQSTV
ncbi:unnamed protein product [Somion occarium]|uniref:Transmembrane protein n=1 Tax=Somion occarium TaxID=3059160 RepID=A0ABP1DK16_9APHY